jgi:hypothetical protein
MKGTAKIDFKLKDGREFKKGEKFEIIPPVRENPSESFIVLGIDEQIRINTAKLGRFFKEFESPRMSDLEAAVMDGRCVTVTGADVEPDGWVDGWPSMLLACGMI